MLDDSTILHEAKTPQSGIKAFLIRWKYLFILIVCTSACYFQSLTFDFVNYDDVDLITQNKEFLSKPENILTSFTSHVFAGKRAEGMYYRPLLQASYIIDYQVWDLSPFGYHLTNLILHCIASILVFFLFKKILKEELLAFFGSLFFALHPIQTEAVGWIAGRNDVLLGIFILLTLLFYSSHRAHPEKGKLYLSLSLLSFTAALFTKEPAVFYILLLPLYDKCFTLASGKELFSKKLFYRFLPYLSIIMLYLMIRFILFKDIIGGTGINFTTPLASRIIQSPAFIIQNLQFLIFPLKQSVVHPVDSVYWLSPPLIIFASLFVLFLLFAFILSLKHDNVLAFGLFWLIIGLFSATNILPLAVPILEHRVFLPIVGFIIIIMQLMNMARTTKLNSFVFPFLLCLSFVMATATFMRLPVWKNSESLWQDAIDKSPRSSRAYFNLSGYYFDLQQFEKVIPVLERYVTLEPFDMMAYSKLRQTYFLVGRYNDAARICKTMIAFSPTSPQRYLDAGILYERMNHLDSAYTIYKHGITADSTAYQLYYQLGLVCERQTNLEESERYYLKAMSINNRYAPALYSLGRLYVKKEQPDQAIRYFEIALTLAQPPREALELLQMLYAKNGKSEKFRQLLQQQNYIQ